MRVREIAKEELAWINATGGHGLVPGDHDTVWWALSLQVFENKSKAYGCSSRLLVAWCEHV